MISTDDRLIYAPMPGRPQVTWPEGKTVAVWHAPNVEHYDYIPVGQGSPQGRTPAPDVQHYMHRDYGNRVGFWRLLRIVDRFEIPSTVSLSLAILEEMPEIRDPMIERGWEVMSHGISNLRPVYDYSAEEEDDFFATSQLLAEKYLGKRLKGMLGPKISGTDRTADLMSRHGMTYYADWIHDEQPRPLRAEGDTPLVSIPYTYMVNDVPLLFAKHYSGEYFADMAIAQISRMLRDAEEDGQGRVACVATHPFVIGQPGMQRHLERVFEYLRSEYRIWTATAEQISDHYLAHHYQAQLDHAEALGADSNRSSAR